MESSKAKKNAALLSISSNIILIVSKFIVGIISGSVSIISEAIHSFADLLAAVLAFYSVKISSEPADIEHQYGHGKFEDLSGWIEGIIMILGAAYIIYEALYRLIMGKVTHIETFAGICVMIASCIINFMVSSHLFKIAHKTDSMALLADAQHLRSDILTGAGVLTGLILIKLTGLSIFDPVIALCISGLIIKSGINLCRASAKNLLDVSLPEEDRELINNTIQKYMPYEVVEAYNLKTRKSGAERLIELTLVVPENLTIKEGHNLCDRIEADMSNFKTLIHLEPCNKRCYRCNIFKTTSKTCHQLREKSQ